MIFTDYHFLFIRAGVLCTQSKIRKKTVIITLLCRNERFTVRIELSASVLSAVPVYAAAYYHVIAGKVLPDLDRG